MNKREREFKKLIQRLDKRLRNSTTGDLSDKEITELLKKLVYHETK